MLTEREVLDALKEVIDPDLGKDIVSLGFVKDLDITDGNVRFRLELTTPACPMRETFRKQCEGSVSRIPGVRSVQVTMSAAPSRPPEGKVDALADVDAIVAVSACKGGVGKSTVAAYMARAMQREGLSVGLLDADIYGPSAPTLFNVQNASVVVRGNLILPADLDGLSVMSLGFVLGDAPAVLRGPIVSNYILQILRQTQWGKLDYLIIDLPPGTGDIQLTVAQQTPLDGAIIVTTPQALSLVDVARGILMFEKLAVPVLGVVENMCSFVCNQCGATHYPFGRSRGTLQERFGLPTLAELPILSDVSDVSSRDAGQQIDAFRTLSEQVHRAVGRSRAEKTPRPEVSPTPDCVVIRWPDGYEAALDNFELRCACPCARCVDEHTGKRILDTEQVPADIWVEDIQFLGNYAVAFRWSDGHSTGIYSWEYLRRLTEKAKTTR